VAQLVEALRYKPGGVVYGGTQWHSWLRRCATSREALFMGVHSGTVG
jgi:hypothetical protein